MKNTLRYDVSEKPLIYSGKKLEDRFNRDRVAEFNHRHAEVLSNYELELAEGAIITLDDRFNSKSNFGALRNRQLRQSVIVAASLSAMAVALHG
ncbi:MAG: hypothetical protein ACREBV_10460, partial [Candidatus Zixiibacteriota bacterium]